VIKRSPKLAFKLINYYSTAAQRKSGGISLAAIRERCCATCSNSGVDNKDKSTCGHVDSPPHLRVQKQVGIVQSIEPVGANWIVKVYVRGLPFESRFAWHSATLLSPAKK